MLRSLKLENFLVDVNQYDVKEMIFSYDYLTIYHAIDKKTKKSVSFSVYHRFTFSKATIYSYIIRNIDTPFVKVLGMIIPTMNKKDEISETKIIKTENGDEIRLYSKTGVIISEYVSNTPLCQMISSHFRKLKFGQIILTPTDISKIIYGIASIMSKFHKFCFFKENLMIYNIFLDEKKEPHIFEFLNFIDILKDIFDPYEMFSYAPEKVQLIKSSYPADVYSFSIIVYSFFSDYKIKSISIGCPISF